MSDAYDKLERWANAAAQELQEMLDDAEDCGSELTGIQGLIDEHDEIMKELHDTWQELLPASFVGDEADRIDFGETH